MTDEDFDQAELQQGIKDLAQGKLDRALTLFQQLAEAEPESRSPYWYLGVALVLLGQEAEAQTTWMLALMEGEPEQVEQWTVDLVTVLRSQAEQQESLGNIPNAWALRQHLREVAPGDLSNLLHLLMRSTELAAFEPRQLAELMPSLGILPLLQISEAIDQALLLQTLKRLLEVAPLEPTVLELAEVGLANNPEPGEWVLALLGAAIRTGYGMGKAQWAVSYAQLCHQIYPIDLNILSHLAGLYQRSNQHTQSIVTARQLCALAETLPEQVIGDFILLRSLLKAGGYWDEIFTLADHQMGMIQELTTNTPATLGPEMVLQLVNSTFFQPYIRDSLALNRQMQNALHEFCQACVEVYAQETIARYRQGFVDRVQTRDPSRPLRIGYVSHCLRRHSVGWLSRWLFQHHDRDRFEIYGYFWNYEPDASDHLQQWFMHNVTVAHTFRCDSQAIANQIFADEVDILVDLDSLTSDIGCEVMMLKPAPVQVTWLGWDAMGSPAIDYFIADPYVLPDTAESHYREKLWRLPQTYIAVDGFEVDIPTLRRDRLNIPADAVIYWSGQSPFKRHPDTVRSQLQIIKAVPNSYFLIKGIVSGEKASSEARWVEDYFLKMAAEVGVDPDRLRFLPEVPEEGVHRADLAIADVVLDTYPYNGATTTLETLWMGIPIVTRAGEHFSSRNSYTMMINAGITEGIAWSAEEYVEWGTRLGQSPELRQQIAWKLWKSRQTAPLWNAQQFTREMEAAYEGMWEQSVGPLNWEQIAIAQVEQKKLEAATTSYQKALAIAPDAAHLHYALGVVQQQRGNWEAAIDGYQQAVKLEPSDRKAWTNLGALFQEMGQPQASIDCYQNILSLDPEDAIAHMNLSIVLRQLGDWERGFAEFEWRWRCPDKAPRDFTQPLWDGSDLDGKTILIHAEDGYGDTIQFIRFLPQVAQRGGRAIVECPPWLVRLLGCVPGIAELVPFGSPLPEFAVHAPLLSLLHLLRATPETLPSPPYLSVPDSTRVTLQADSDRFDDRFKVGIVWAGNPNHQRDHDRSTTLEQFLPLLAVEGVAFYSLQKGPRSPELAQFSQRSQIQDLSAELEDFADTAAAIEQLDLVISVDTSVAHLAGALGKPVWVLLSHNADWRWMLDRNDTPWYHTLRLFRQSQRGDWAGVFARVAQELQAIAAPRPRV